MKKILQKDGTASILASVVSILVGLLFGLIVLFIVNAPMAWPCFKSMLSSGFSSTGKLAKVLYQAAPLVMCGLSVGFAFKTGLFNIGATGQYTMGAFVALTFAIEFQMPWYICLLAAGLAGAIWGMFPGLFKALFNVNEVITSIMFNWISLFAVNLSLLNMEKMRPPYWVPSPVKDRTASLKYANPSAIIPKLGLDKVFDSSYINISFFIAILFAILMYVILNKTTFGYELKACGHNRDAAQYAGINAKRNIVLSMVIAGALAGIAGGIYYQSGEADYNIVKALQVMGFNGIPVALLATSHPIGTIFSALFVSYIQVGGESMQPHFAVEVINIIISVIIYLAAFALLTKNLIYKLGKKKQKKTEAKLEVAEKAAENAAETIPAESAPAPQTDETEPEKETEKEADGE